MCSSDLCATNNPKPELNRVARLLVQSLANIQLPAFRYRLLVESLLLPLATTAANAVGTEEECDITEESESHCE